MIYYWLQGRAPWPLWLPDVLVFSFALMIAVGFPKPRKVPITSPAMPSSHSARSSYDSLTDGSLTAENSMGSKERLKNLAKGGIQVMGLRKRLGSRTDEDKMRSDDEVDQRKRRDDQRKGKDDEVDQRKGTDDELDQRNRRDDDQRKTTEQERIAKKKPVIKTEDGWETEEVECPTLASPGFSATSSVGSMDEFSLDRKRKRKKRVHSLTAQTAYLLGRMRHRVDAIRAAALNKPMTSMTRFFQDRQQQLQCIVCTHQLRDVIIQPCGHLCLCHDCSLEMDLTKCPICFKTVKETTRIYWS